MSQLEVHLQTNDAQSGRLPHLGLIVRCIVEPKDGQWQAFSLEFGLAAQADTKEAAKRSLDNMIRSYLYDALVGEDREHARKLLARKARWPVYFRYYLSYLFNGRSAHQAYHDPVALIPAAP